MTQDNIDQKTFPSLSETAWWKIRQRFKQTMPSILTNAYLATVLGAKPDSIGQYLRNLKAIGLIDSANKPTDRALRWRDDHHYPEVCQEILQEVYPGELLSLLSGSETEIKQAISRWFLLTAKVGENAAGKMCNASLA
jgi:hypothetical protein